MERYISHMRKYYESERTVKDIYDQRVKTMHQFVLQTINCV